MYFFFSFLLCVTAIKNINLLSISTVQIQCLLVHFLFLWQFQHGVCSQLNLCSRQFSATVMPISLVALPWSYPVPHWSRLTLSQLATVFLSEEPWNTATCTPQSTSNTNRPGTAAAMVPGPCYNTSQVPWDAEPWTTLAPCCYSQSHVQWPFVHTSREKAAYCTGLFWKGCLLPRNPRQMAKSLFPPAPAKISRRKK